GGLFWAIANRRSRPQRTRALPPAILCKPFGFGRMCGLIRRRKVVKKIKSLRNTSTTTATSTVTKNNYKRVVLVNVVVDVDVVVNVVVNVRPDESRLAMRHCAPWCLGG
ncbi:MAG TPA: hypothetical protein VGL91_01310, partial [Acidobacteriota bacterium]